MLGLGFAPKTTQRIWNQYREEALHTARKNPYAFIAKIKYFGFNTADSIAMKNGLIKDSPFRINAALSHVLTLSEEEGHCYLPRDLLLSKTEELLGLGTNIIEPVLELSLKKGFLVLVGTDRVYRNDLFIFESESAKEMQRIIYQKIQDTVPEDRLKTLLRRLSKLDYNTRPNKGNTGSF